LYGQILAAIGVLPTGQLVEVSRADLVAEHIGGTAMKTTERFNAAIGGLLFLDEAYTLAPVEGGGTGHDFCREAIDTLVKLIEDHRDKVVVIAAGYSTRMRQFLDSNPGLASRFSKTMEFESYSTDELVTIVERLCGTHHYSLEYDTRAALEKLLDGTPPVTKVPPRTFVRPIGSHELDFRGLCGCQSPCVLDSTDCGVVGWAGRTGRDRPAMMVCCRAGEHLSKRWGGLRRVPRPARNTRRRLRSGVRAGRSRATTTVGMHPERPHAFHTWAVLLSACPNSARTTGDTAPRPELRITP
jgi:hypothetical protein